MMRAKSRVQLVEKSFQGIFFLSYWERLFDQKGEKIDGWRGNIAFGKKAFKGGGNGKSDKLSWKTFNSDTEIAR
ncbi:MAG: hypothetical protein LBR92_03785 [Puniceicoccales bacterium]|nr:hypothetical protein [Puniceicoccales bacterium]